MMSFVSTPIAFGSVIRERSLGSFILTEVRHEPNSVVSEHAHDRLNVCSVLSGAFLEWGESRRWECRRGTVIVKPPGYRHGNRYGPAAERTLIIQIQPSNAHTGFFSRAFAEPTAFDLSAQLPWWAGAILAEWRATDDVSAIAVEGLLLQLGATMLRLRDGAATSCPAWLSRARERLHEQWSEELTISDLAAEARVHPVHLVRTFRQRFGVTPAMYVRRLRLSRAAELLANSRYSISRVAMDAGFAQHAHFTRLFRLTMGETPSAYRRRVQAGQKRS